MGLDKKHAISWAQKLADNLNRNVMLDHIEYVEKGIRPKDADYFKFLKIKDNLVSLEQFQKWKYSKKIKKMSLFKIGACIILALVVIFALGGSLYWVEIRPGNIRTACANSIRGKGYSFYIANNYYRLCLTVHGLKPESLFVNASN